MLYLPKNQIVSFDSIPGTFDEYYHRGEDIRDNYEASLIGLLQGNDFITFNTKKILQKMGCLENLTKFSEEIC